MCRRRQCRIPLSGGTNRSTRERRRAAEPAREPRRGREMRSSVATRQEDTSEDLFNKGILCGLLCASASLRSYSLSPGGEDRFRSCLLGGVPPKRVSTRVTGGSPVPPRLGRPAPLFFIRVHRCSSVAISSSPCPPCLHGELLRLDWLRLRRLWLHLCRRWRRWRGVVRVPSLSSPLGRRAVGRRAGGLSGGHPCGRGLLLVPLVVQRLELFGLLGLFGGEVLRFADVL